MRISTWLLSNIGDLPARTNVLFEFLSIGNHYYRYFLCATVCFHRSWEKWLSINRYPLPPFFCSIFFSKIFLHTNKSTCLRVICFFTQLCIVAIHTIIPSNKLAHVLFASEKYMFVENIVRERNNRIREREKNNRENDKSSCFS